MNKNEIKRKIAQLIGIANYSFGSYKTKEGVELKMESETIEVGAPIYVITPEGELPAPENEYELENGMIVSVKEGLVEGITPTAMEKDNTEMAEATLADGTKVTNGTDAELAEGQPLFVVQEDGALVQAPEGEHTTDSGITIVVDAEGLITGIKRPDEAGEGSLVEQAEEVITDEKDELLKAVLTAVEKLAEEVKEMKKDASNMKQEFSKIKASPAGERVYDRKGSTPVSFSKADALLELKNKTNKKFNF